MTQDFYHGKINPSERNIRLKKTKLNQKWLRLSSESKEMLTPEQVGMYRRQIAFSARMLSNGTFPSFRKALKRFLFLTDRGRSKTIIPIANIINIIAKILIFSKRLTVLLSFLLIFCIWY